MKTREHANPVPIRWDRVPEHLRRPKPLKEVLALLDAMTCSGCGSAVSVSEVVLTKMRHPNGTFASLAAVVKCKGCSVKPVRVSTMFCVERRADGPAPLILGRV